MSLGFVLTYGKFRLFSGGDFSGIWPASGKKNIQVENLLGRELDSVDVCKMNHHGYHSMFPDFVRGVRARVYVSCVWDQLHNTADTMSRVCDYSLYPGDRLVCLGIFPKERREKDAGAAWLKCIAPESFDGGHVVVCVPPNGETYSVSYLTASDESMRVTGTYSFSASH